MVPAVLVAYVVAVAIGFVVRRAARHQPVLEQLPRRARRPLRISLVLLAALSVLNAADLDAGWLPPTRHTLTIALIAAVAWLLAASTYVVEELVLSRYRIDVSDNRHARRVRTQIMVVRRLIAALVAVVALATILMTFPDARTAGASILASAGVLGIVAGLAAQTSLANVFAGLQLAFTDALRVDDVVVVNDEWGRIEEITMTYVVVHVWDDRRLILPSTWFTSQPFENWTRSTAAVLGAVDFDVDWMVPVEDMRAELHRVLDGTDLWDRRVGVLQVTDAVNSYVHLRVLVSGVDGPTVFDLRCHVREALVTWLRENHPDALPRLRTEAVTHGRPSRHAPTLPQKDGDGDARLFSGSAEAAERSAAFAGGEPAPDGSAPRRGPGAANPTGT